MTGLEALHTLLTTTLLTKTRGSERIEVLSREVTMMGTQAHREIKRLTEAQRDLAIELKAYTAVAILALDPQEWARNTPTPELALEAITRRLSEALSPGGGR